ncbi:hypothetical protein JIN84_13040 [Luteolibacter yonseiensis]|uniref:Uncharacterized protein n=1 Tax=Luteolibacter yonseiensis TaxID=1144680 RepID=A0A934VBW4_9BACT|nr:hypothetical protein [Luteolibacter yonseiensis]MBK1816545.1 hypothetical protein [Luteolibacter yonseiensis]
MDILDAKDPGRVARVREMLLRTINSENPAKKHGNRYDEWEQRVYDAKEELAILDSRLWALGIDNGEYPY